MNILFWNLRGIDNVDTHITLRNLFLTHKPLLIFIAEPMIEVSQIPAWYWQSIGVLKLCVNDRHSLLPNLWAMWGRDINPSIIFVSSQCIVLEISFQQTTAYVAGIYTSTSYLSRRHLWVDLTRVIGMHHGLWLFYGNFNAVLGAHEKRGRWPPPSLSCTDFLHWSNVNLLSHLPSFGSFFTLSNGRLGLENVALRLDREICNIDWLNIWQRTTCSSLVRHHSDHHPLLISVEGLNVRNAVPFKFFKTWTSHEDCRRLVLEVWSKRVCGSGMVRLQLKLKNLKNAFKTWNRTTFGDVDRQVCMAVDEVNRIQHLIDTNGISDNLYAQDLEAQLLLTKAWIVQDTLWKEKARN